MHSQLGKDVNVPRQRLEKKKNAEGRHREGPCRFLPLDLQDMPDDFDDEQNSGRKGGQEKQCDQNSKPGIRAIQSPKQIEPATDKEQDEHLGQQRNDDSKGSQPRTEIKR